ncbi:trans-sialidase, putative, partial [Trypanosoma cruzi marinkellei]
AAAAGESNVKKAVDALMGIEWEKLDSWEDGSVAGGKYGSLRCPSLVEVQGHVFAIAEAHCKDEEKCSDVSSTGIASKYLDLSGVVGPTEISTSDASIFGTDLLKEEVEGIQSTNCITRPTTLLIGDSVYMLLGNYRRRKQQIQFKNERGLLLVNGALSEDDGRKKIRWNETHVVKPQGKGYSSSLTEVLGGGGSAAVMRDGTLVFPMQAKGNDGKSVLLSMSFIPSRKNWELSSTTPGEGCRDPTLVKWKEDVYGEDLFMMAHCAGGYYDVYKSSSDGVNWYKKGEPITRAWGNSRDRTGYGVQSGFITVTIEDKEVMLITAPLYPKEENEGVKGRLHLWVSDNTRVHDVGPVSRENDDAAASSLLMKGNDNKELISLYENRKSDGSYSLVAVRLTEKLERIKEVVKTWKDLDSELRTCSYPAVADPVATKGMCIGPVPTEGLVGFLSGNSTQTEWRDEYLGVNATVTNGERRVPNGWTFKGSGAGAVWPVGDMGQTVPYYFANNEFTLVATVFIHEAPKESSSPIPLMGVKMNDTDSTVLFGLSYTHDKKWLAISENSGNAEHGGDGWEPNKTYQVVLQMDTDYWTVFVDQEKIHYTEYNDHLFNSHRISHFYIGGDSKDKSTTGGHVTVTNVLLYNEKLSETDLDGLQDSQVTIPSPGAEKNPTEQAASTGNLVVSDSKSEEIISSHANLTEDDTEQQRGEKNVHDPVHAASSSTVAAGSFVSEPATAEKSAGASRPEGGAQLSEGEPTRQTTLSEGNGSMGRGSEVQSHDPHSAESREVIGFESSSESNGAQPREEEDEANDRSGGSTSSVAVSSDMDTAAIPADGEHQVQQSTEPSGENEDVRSIGTGATSAEEGLSLEAGDRNSERTMNSDSSLTLPKSDAEPKSAEDTDVISRNEGAEFPSEDGEEVPQTVETTPDNTNTTPGETRIPSESNATLLSAHDISLEHRQLSDLSAMALVGDSTVHGCVSRVFLLLLLGLCVFAFLC